MQGAIEAIQPIQGSEVAAPSWMPATNAAPSTGFVNWMAKEATQLNTQLLRAEEGVQRLATGDAGNLHDVMLQLEQARLALQLATQVRARVIEAYQEVMRMQV